jgi:hypothetical protein
VTKATVWNLIRQSLRKKKFLYYNLKNSVTSILWITLNYLKIDFILFKIFGLHVICSNNLLCFSFLHLKTQVFRQSSIKDWNHARRIFMAQDKSSPCHTAFCWQLFVYLFIFPNRFRNSLRGDTVPFHHWMIRTITHGFPIHWTCHVSDMVLIAFRHLIFAQLFKIEIQKGSDIYLLVMLN